MGLQAEVPLVAFLGLVHLGIARLVLILRRRRRIDDGGIYDRAARDRQSFLGQMRIDQA